VRLSEVVHHAYYPYFGSCPRRWSIYAYTGTGEPTAEEGWANWVEIGTGDNNHLPNSDASDQSARIAAYPLGDTTHIVANAPVARYYRFKCQENRYWKDGQGGAAQPYYNFQLTEIKVFIQDETDAPTPPMTVAEVPHYAPFKVTGFDPDYTSDAIANPVYLWDKRWPVTYTGGSNQTWAGEAAYKNFNVASNVNEPSWFTFDIGAPLKLASYRHHYYYSFDFTCPLFWELYAFTGTGAPTAADGWNNWVKIGEGNTDHLPTKSAADQSARVAAYPLGETLTFEKSAVPAARYYRFKCLENWKFKNGSTTKDGGISLSEIICKAYVDAE
jgi:hypothetical protein